MGRGAAWPNWMLIILAVAIGLPGITAPFGSTTLGCLGISRIRSSHGRLIGMPLAVGVALFYPLLILDAVLFTFVATEAFFTFPFIDQLQRYGLEYGTALAAIIVLILLLDFFIVRATWRAATRPTQANEPV